MAKGNRPTAHACLNISNSTTSHILLKGHGSDFPTHPDVSVVDINNTDTGTAVRLDFTVLRQDADHGNTRRMLLRIRANNTLAGGGDAVTDGLIQITIRDTDHPAADPIIVELPVEYIKDPTAP